MRAQELSVTDLGGVHLEGKLKEAALRLAAYHFFEGQPHVEAARNAAEQCLLMWSRVKDCIVMDYAYMEAEYCPCAWLLAALHEKDVETMTTQELHQIMKLYIGEFTQER